MWHRSEITSSDGERSVNDLAGSGRLRDPQRGRGRGAVESWPSLAGMADWGGSETTGRCLACGTARPRSSTGFEPDWFNRSMTALDQLKD